MLKYTDLEWNSSPGRLDFMQVKRDGLGGKNIYSQDRFPVLHVPSRHIWHRGIHCPCPPSSVPTPAHFKFVKLLGRTSVPVFLCIEVHWALLRFLVSSQMVTAEVMLGKGKGSIFSRQINTVTSLKLLLQRKAATSVRLWGLRWQLIHDGCHSLFISGKKVLRLFSPVIKCWLIPQPP